ncbi:MAG: imidazole glycerol phosphate synthase subunit HisF [Clostridia bacterium]|nr:imidazole glycerol phosphate synthase subunit HisF [Clostridia bacterium]
MLAKRIIPCLDIKNGMVVKGTNFSGIREVLPPVELAQFYNLSGADELVFYDITASAEGRKLFTDTLKQVASCIFIPLTVGGGISSLQDFDVALKCGADKVSVNSGAISDPSLIGKAAKMYGNQCVVLSMDVKRVDGKFTVFSHGGRINTGICADEWAYRGQEEGAGELVLNSIDTDGVKGGFDTEMLNKVCKRLSIPVIASGGAGKKEDFLSLFRSVPKADAGLAASVFHFKEINIQELKIYLKQNGIQMRTDAHMA